MPTTQFAHPIFSFADAELGPVSNAVVRGIEKISGQPRIRKLYFDYVEEGQPYENFWSDALDRLNIRVRKFAGWGGAEGNAAHPRYKTTYKQKGGANCGASELRLHEKLFFLSGKLGRKPTS